MSIVVTLSGEGIDFEREVSEAQAADIVTIALKGKLGENGPENDESTDSTDSEAVSKLPESFISRLSRKQEAYVRTLLDADEWLTNASVRERMAEQCDVETGGPQSISGIRAGFTRKYGDESDIDEQRWTGEQNEYRLNPAYADDLASELDL